MNTASPDNPPNRARLKMTKRPDATTSDSNAFVTARVGQNIGTKESELAPDTREPMTLEMMKPLKRSWVRTRISIIATIRRTMTGLPPTRLKELDARASADLRTSIPTEPVIEAMMARKTNTEYAGRLFVNIAIGSENPSPIIRPGEYVYSVESDEANTYSEGEIGSQLTESALSDSADAFSSHRSPMVK